MLQTLLGILIAAGLAVLLARKFVSREREKREAPERMFAATRGVLDDGRIEPGQTIGSHRLTGRYQELPVQVQTVVDTLSLRKLPSLWLMVTIPEPLPVKATFDLMMRPTGPSTFSNFDHLPVTIDLPEGFPQHAVVRTDDPDHVLPAHVVAPHLDLFREPRAKELLISPKGIRMVTQLAEGDRARYGVFRQAEFGDIEFDAAALRDILDRMIALRHAIANWSRIGHE